ncbi:MAG: hypothetical protein KGI51_15160, partial [Rhodospirillales bacterium]|nr:hypothetical protein [Rhodospirillales bacterium]
MTDEPAGGLPANPWAAQPPSPTPPRRRLGPLQGAILMIGFFAIQPLVAAIAFLLRGAALALHHRGALHPLAMPPPPAHFIAATAIVAYALAASWAWGYALRRAGARLRQGGADGVG